MKLKIPKEFIQILNEIEPGLFIKYENEIIKAVEQNYLGCSNISEIQTQFANKDYANVIMDSFIWHVCEYADWDLAYRYLDEKKKNNE